MQANDQFHAPVTLYPGKDFAVLPGWTPEPARFSGEEKNLLPVSGIELFVVRCQGLILVTIPTEPSPLTGVAEQNETEAVL